nr:MAG TPA: hypothetical protein [Caudoviricetes sp.]
MCSLVFPGIFYLDDLGHVVPSFLKIYFYKK